MVYIHIAPEPFNWSDCYMTLFVGCFAVLYHNIRILKNLFKKLPAEREQYKGSTNSADHVKGVNRHNR